MSADDAWMTSEQTAKYIGISKETLLNWVAGGVIPAFRPGGKVLFFRRSEVDAAMAAKPVESKTETGGVS